MQSNKSEQISSSRLSIVDITVAECKRRGFKKVGILGMNVTMSDGLYVEPLKKVGIEPINLPSEKQKEVSNLIFDEIIIGKPTLNTADKLRVFMACDQIETHQANNVWQSRLCRSANGCFMPCRSAGKAVFPPFNPSEEGTLPPLHRAPRKILCLRRSS